jgi:hypothetical protein
MLSVTIGLSTWELVIEAFCPVLDMLITLFNSSFAAANFIRPIQECHGYKYYQKNVVLVIDQCPKS